MNRDMMRLAAVLLLTFVAASACQSRQSATRAATRPTATGAAATGAAATRPESDAMAVYVALLDASIAQDREKLRELVLLPADEKRRQWVLNIVDKGELPPPNAKRRAPEVKIDGPVAVCQVQYQLPDGSTEHSPPGFLVQRDGRWKAVIDYFEGGGLTQDEMEVINRHLGQM
jgi:hypothetical protein